MRCTQQDFYCIILFMIKAVFIDFDGTLYSHRSNRIPDSTVMAIEKLRENNILVFLCTGRAQKELEEFDLRNVVFDGQILNNGQLILNENSQAVFNEPITGELKDRIISMFNGNEVSMYLCTSNGIYTNFINDACIKCQKAVNSSVPPLGKYEGEDLYMGVGFFDDEKTRERILEFEDIADTTSWAVGAVDIVPKGASKAKAVKEAAMVYGFDLSETMGFGDGENDIPMLQECEIGVCMGNGYEPVKKVADYITDDIDEDGLYNALKHFNII